MRENGTEGDGGIGADLRRNAGSFRFRFADRHWEWSDEIARMHGYPPGGVTPTTELLLAHLHPEDHDRVAGLLDRSAELARPFSSRHRIVDTEGEIHHVVVVADRLPDADGAIIGTAGWFVDVTGTLATHRRETLDEQLPELYAARAVIEQAKGALMLVYGVSPEQAFRVLSWRSQETNTKLRALATRLLADFGTLGPHTADVRARFDHLLLTAHDRVEAD